MIAVVMIPVFEERPVVQGAVLERTYDSTKSFQVWMSSPGARVSQLKMMTKIPLELSSLGGQLRCADKRIACLSGPAINL